MTTALLIWNGVSSIALLALFHGYAKLRTDDRKRLIEALEHGGADLRRRVHEALGRKPADDLLRRPREKLGPIIHAPEERS
jgi:hypothetical protein